MPLEYAIGTVNILKAILCMKEATLLKSIDEQQRKVDESFTYIDTYEVQLQRLGFKHSQLIRLLQYCQILTEDIGTSAIQADIKHVELAKGKL